MDDSQFDRTPNPFSAFAEEKGESRGQLIATSKFLTVSIGLFLLVTAGQVYWNRAKISRWSESFAAQPSEEKIDRLRQLSQSGEPGIAILVNALSDSQPGVSKTAADLLFEMQSRWELMPSNEANGLRETLARELVDVASRLGPIDDPRSQRVRAIANRAAKDLIASGQAQNARAYQDLMTVMALPHRNAGHSSQLLSQESNSQRHTTSHQQAALPQMNQSRVDGVSDSENAAPLPLDLAGDAGTVWTDWPPTASTPSLYRPHVESLASIQKQEVVLQQSVGTQIASGGKAELLRPRLQPEANHTAVDRQLAVLVNELNSRSRYVRMQAVTALAKRRDESARRVLRSHMANEPDHEIAKRIARYLDRGIDDVGN